jgi:LAO/AO transport system kinase
MLRGHVEGGWDVPVLTCAGLTGEGLDVVWAKLVEHQDRMKASGAFEERRRTQQVRWTWQLVRDGLEHQLREHPGVRAAVPELEKAVLSGELTPALAAQQILQTFLATPGEAPAVSS